MCGIAGIWHLNGEKLKLEKLKRFTDSLAHRGTDGSGYKIFDEVNLGLGHRRLSILDISPLAAQPMCYADERYWLTYNGEVYNFIELRVELQKSGYKFQSDSDSEVVLAAFVQWGRECLFRFNGMWGMAIYDKKERNLFLARDRFGVKPLYYAYLSGKYFAFASETYSFGFLDGMSKTINKDLLMRSLVKDEIEPYGLTIYNNIRQIEPGCSASVNSDGHLKLTRWWDTGKHLCRVPARYDEQVEQFDELFSDACRIRLRSDVPVATALSGGLDSSSVYCKIHDMMKYAPNVQRLPGNWQTAYVNTFEGTAHDETEYAKQVVDLVGGNAIYISANYPDLANEIQKATVLFDAINATPLIVSADIYKAMSKDGIKVSLDGHGMDEIMYGYPPCVKMLLFDACRDDDSTRPDELLDIYLNLYPVEKQNSLKKNLLDEIRNVKTFHKKTARRSFVEKSARKLLKPLWLAINSDKKKRNMGEWYNNYMLSDMPGHFYENNNIASDGEKYLYSTFHVYALPYILRNFDRAAMQSGVEIRAPFLDWRIVTFAMSLPAGSKIGKGFTKRLLRDSMKGILPESIRLRKLKLGLMAPVDNWFNNHLKDFILDETNSEGFLSSPYWNGQLIREFAEKKCRSSSWEYKNATKMWNILNAHILIKQL